MIEGLKAYSAYRRAPLRWLPSFPKHWDMQRGKNLFRESALPVRDGDGVVTCFRDGQVTLRTNRRTSGFTNAILEGGYQGVREGQLVIHAMDAFAGAVGVSDSEGKCTPEYAVCDPITNANPYYYAWLLREAARLKYILIECPAVRERAPRFRYPMFGNMSFPVPPPDEQAAIVKFIDYADRRIRRYIRAKQELIKLLEEQKQAIIHQAVTRSLDPSVRLKPSGVEWLGDVPAHWEVKRLKHLLSRIDQGVSPQAEARLAERGWWGVLKSGCVNGGFFRQTEHKRLPDGFQVDTSLAVKVGDILVSRACGSPRFVGSVGRVETIDYQLILSDKTFRVVPKDPAFGLFLVAAMNSRYYRRQVRLAISGAEGMANNLPLSSLRDFLILVPPVDEAARIEKDLQLALAKLDHGALRAEREIDLLREYRTRLIADVVTGKLDVRQAAANLPDEPDTDEPDLDESDDMEEPDDAEAEESDE